MGVGESVGALKVALVGLGVAAQVVYLPLLARRRDIFQVSAVCDLDGAHAETLGRELGVRSYDRAMAMLEAGGFDALIVLTPGSHGPLVKAALACGCWVLCEKPLAYSRAELHGIPGDARLMVGYVKQYDPATQRLLSALGEAGGARAVRRLDATVLHPSEESQLLFARARVSRPASERLAPYLEADDEAIIQALGTVPERLRRLYSQVLLGDVRHELSVMRLLVGSPATVDHVSVWPDDVFPPSVEVSGRLPDPAYGRYGLCWHHLPDYPVYRETIAVHHDHGSLELCFPTHYLLNAPTSLTVLSRAGTAERTAAYRDLSEAYERQLVAFHRFVTQDEPPLTGLDGALKDIITAQRIIRRHAEQTGLSVGGECGE
ncbi:hypothetical protein GCM10009530_58720 [Microbispora corallina]|uniref:Gfo/Idh/MocA family protein n=1 Tax=Microbispora corallina TaxID=83302 RepID=UPI001EF2CFF3|nr:Gfo/Idh/MocA family oxidoreductase [Microbispora corallina]